MVDPHLTPQQLAERLHMTTGGLARWRCMGGGPSYIKIGRRVVLYPVKEVEKWEASKLQRNTFD